MRSSTSWVVAANWSAGGRSSSISFRPSRTASTSSFGRLSPPSIFRASSMCASTCRICLRAASFQSPGATSRRASTMVRIPPMACSAACSNPRRALSHAVNNPSEGAFSAGSSSASRSRRRNDDGVGQIFMPEKSSRSRASSTFRRRLSMAQQVLATRSACSSSGPAPPPSPSRSRVTSCRRNAATSVRAASRSRTTDRRRLRYRARGCIGPRSSSPTARVELNATVEPRVTMPGGHDVALPRERGEARPGRDQRHKGGSGSRSGRLPPRVRRLHATMRDRCPVGRPGRGGTGRPWPAATPSRSAPIPAWTRPGARSRSAPRLASSHVTVAARRGAQPEAGARTARCGRRSRGSVTPRRASQRRSPAWPRPGWLSRSAGWRTTLAHRFAEHRGQTPHPRLPCVAADHEPDRLVGDVGVTDSQSDLPELFAATSSWTR